MQDVRFGPYPPEFVFAKEARAGGRNRLVYRSFAFGNGNANHKIHRIAQASSEQSPARLGPSMVRQAGQESARAPPGFSPSTAGRAVAVSKNVVSTRSPFARMPNPSVNLTRNSVPRWPSEARYAHNAPLVQQVTLPRAGYLKR
jgi:hypothetical protein